MSLGRTPSSLPPPEAEQPFADYLRNVTETGQVRTGRPLPLGVHLAGDGANFAIFSRHATRLVLEFYQRPEDAAPCRVIPLEPAEHRSGDVWHVWVQGVRPGQLYAYRAEGPYRPREGHRFNPHRLLLDPYATSITQLDGWDFGPARGYDITSAERDLSYAVLDDAAVTPKCVFTDNGFAWEGDRPLQRPWSETVIYEAHVRGLTIHSNSGVSCPGTYRGLTEKIPYLQSLGVTAVELMPVQEFNENELILRDPFTGQRLKNYWGYSPVAFFAPKAAYARSGGGGQQVLEFREMVKALHHAGIEVILDVVFNHTAEGNEEGPTISFRGLDNSIYYMLGDDRRYYRDYTGTGNSVNANHPVVRDLIMGALRHWVVEMHVDGFRFDLASVLGRDSQGNLLPEPPLLEHIAEDPILRQVKIIAEAWDAAGAYQVGSFSAARWAEWNGRFRDDVRRFWRGDEGMVGQFASRLCGSSDLYQRSGKGPQSSINFVTCHDGFTLHDLVSHNRKHNEANGEENRDGSDENFSHNYGLEGETENPAIQWVRARQVKNLLVTLFVSRGVPMLLAGDEFRRTQRGNNNAYCQDNEISWLDWRLLDQHPDIHRFAQGLIVFRQAHPVLSAEAFYTDADIRWHSPEGPVPNWHDPQERRLACHILGAEDAPDLYLMFNAGLREETFQLPTAPEGTVWRRAVDTSLPSPEDLRPAGEEAELWSQHLYRLGPRASVILLSISQEPQPNTDKDRQE